MPTMGAKPSSRGQVASRWQVVLVHVGGKDAQVASELFEGGQPVDRMLACSSSAVPPGHEGGAVVSHLPFRSERRGDALPAGRSGTAKVLTWIPDMCAAVRLPLYLTASRARSW